MYVLLRRFNLLDCQQAGATEHQAQHSQQAVDIKTNAQHFMTRSCPSAVSMLVSFC